VSPRLDFVQRKMTFRPENQMRICANLASLPSFLRRKIASAVSSRSIFCSCSLLRSVRRSTGTTYSDRAEVISISAQLGRRTIDTSEVMLNSS
jgi:hypothetical protein